MDINQLAQRLQRSMSNSLRNAVKDACIAIKVGDQSLHIAIISDALIINNAKMAPNATISMTTKTYEHLMTDSMSWMEAYMRGLVQIDQNCGEVEPIIYLFDLEIARTKTAIQPPNILLPQLQ